MSKSVDRGAARMASTVFCPWTIRLKDEHNFLEIFCQCHALRGFTHFSHLLMSSSKDVNCTSFVSGWFGNLAFGSMSRI